ncbi:hypothetical protein [Bradyrhizobium sp. RT7a]
MSRIDHQRAEPTLQRHRVTIRKRTLPFLKPFGGTGITASRRHHGERDSVTTKRA